METNNMWLSDDFYKEEGNFIQFSAVFNNQEVFPRAWGTTLHVTVV